ncbi:MAG: RNA polymerase-binding protein DksA [Alphaproteobacteria bacterium]|nr:RNA polymerase-binding protein DksA [Alphaproteobacteria bacterium]
MSDSPQSLPPDEYLSAEEITTLHDILQQQLAEILSESKEELHDLTEQREVDADELDLAVSESNRDFQLRLADRERRLLRKIQRALQRMQNGEYGVCESCGNPISFPRLMARPVASQCIDCKTEMEQLERPKRAFV